MKEWFLTTGGDPFTLFGTSHLVVLVIYLLLAFILLYFRREIRSHHSLFQSIRWILFTQLIASEVFYQLWTFTHGIWLDNLPFHLCGVAGIVGAIALLTWNKNMITIAFFIGLFPALMALITPDLQYDIPNFRYFKFFIHHISISLTSLFLAVTSPAGTITLKRMLQTYLYLVIYAFFIGLVINPWLDANYLFLARPPASASPLDWFGSGIWYILNLGLVALIVFFLQYHAHRFVEKQDQKR